MPSYGHARSFMEEIRDESKRIIYANSAYLTNRIKFDTYLYFRHYLKTRYLRDEDFSSIIKKGGEEMKISYILAVAVGLIAVSTAYASVPDNELQLTAQVTCPTQTVSMPGAAISAPIVIPNTLTGNVPLLITRCGPWFISVKSDKDDAKMESINKAGRKLTNMLSVEAQKIGGAGESTGPINPTTTSQTLCYGLGSQLDTFKGVLSQPTAYTDIPDSYKMVISFTMSAIV